MIYMVTSSMDVLILEHLEYRGQWMYKVPQVSSLEPRRQAYLVVSPTTHFLCPSMEHNNVISMA